MTEIDHKVGHSWHVQINRFVEENGYEGNRFMYEAKNATNEIPRLTKLFGMERRGELTKVHRQCSISKPEPVRENHLSCCLGNRCSECPMLQAIEKIEGTDDQKDFAKAMTCVTHIITEGGDVTNEGYLLTVDDRMYWDNVYESLAIGGAEPPSDAQNGDSDE